MRNRDVVRRFEEEFMDRNNFEIVDEAACRTALVVVANVAVAGLALALSGLAGQWGGQLVGSLESSGA